VRQIAALSGELLITEGEIAAVTFSQKERASRNKKGVTTRAAGTAFTLYAFRQKAAGVEADGGVQTQDALAAARAAPDLPTSEEISAELLDARGAIHAAVWDDSDPVPAAGGAGRRKRGAGEGGAGGAGGAGGGGTGGAGGAGAGAGGAPGRE